MTHLFTQLRMEDQRACTAGLKEINNYDLELQNIVLGATSLIVATNMGAGRSKTSAKVVHVLML